MDEISYHQTVGMKHEPSCIDFVHHHHFALSVDSSKSDGSVSGSQIYGCESVRSFMAVFKIYYLIKKEKKMFLEYINNLLLLEYDLASVQLAIFFASNI